MKTILTQEQSQHLIDLGVLKENASISEDIYGPALFRLKDFLNGKVLPKETLVYGELSIFWDCNLQEWSVFYNMKWDNPFRAEELIDALYQLACWYYGTFKK